ncbi:MAG TPA: ABC transporter ATP-binding protein [Candidatus Acidoferrum sp.]|nr:ABC transporter ATP-binding protein [Candidatus Acidoferrum sp.]
MSIATPLLEIENLHVVYRSRAGGELRALAGISFELHAGEIVGVLGESGCGKSTLAAALLRLLPANGAIEQGVVRFEGQDLLQKRSQELETIRGKKIGLIFQEPSLALHPTIRVGEQIRAVILAHESLDRRASRRKTSEILQTLFSSEAKRIGNSHPHQLSGGQRQRVLLGQAIACGPSLLIADEPTASLDPSTQKEILSHLQALRQQRNLAMLLITHNPAILAGLADRILVLYAGRVAEIGPAQGIFAAPQHPYTRALLQCLPPPIFRSTVPSKAKLPAIPGDSAQCAQLTHGCRFEPRCSDRMDICTAKEPAVVMLGPDHGVSCFKYGG